MPRGNFNMRKKSRVATALVASPYLVGFEPHAGSDTVFLFRHPMASNLGVGFVDGLPYVVGEDDMNALNVGYPERCLIVPNGVCVPTAPEPFKFLRKYGRYYTTIQPRLFRGILSHGLLLPLPAELKYASEELILDLLIYNWGRGNHD